MFVFFANFSALFADAAPPAVPAAGQPQGDPWMSLLFMAPVILIFFWFFLLRPQQKQEEKQRRMIDSLEKNDRVLTVGGIIGLIHLVDKETNEVVLKVDDGNGTKIRFVVQAIAQVFPKDKDKDKEKSS